MEVSDTRRQNLGVLIDEYKTQAALSDASGIPVAYINQIIHSRRGMGHKTARTLEEACRKPNGWMDITHESHNTGLDELLSIYEKLGPEKQTFLLEQARLTYKLTQTTDERPSPASKPTKQVPKGG